MFGWEFQRFIFLQKNRHISQNLYNKVATPKKRGRRNISNNDSIKKFVGLQDVIITNIKESSNNIELFMQLEEKGQECPCCHQKTKKIHDYRVQRVTDIPYFNNGAYG